MPECAKTRLQQSRISKFSGGGPPLQGRGGKGKGGEGKGRREGKDREGRRGTGRDRGGREGRNGGVGRGWALDMGSAPLETSSGSAPVAGWRVLADWAPHG